MTTRIGIDINYFKGKNKNFNLRDIDIIFVGSMRWTPNVDNVIWFANRVFPFILKELPKAKFYIVGRNPSQRVINLRSDHIIATGEVEDVRKYLNRSKVSFLFSFSGSGIKIKVMELLAMGVPIICDRDSLQGYNKENIKGVLILKKNEPIKLLESIHELIFNKKKWQKISDEAVAYAKEHFDYKTIKWNFKELERI